MIDKMELCTARGISNLPALYSKHFSPIHIQFQSLHRCTTHFSLLHKHTRFNSGLQYRSNSSLRSTTSEDISTDTTGTTTYVKDEPKPDGVTTVEDTQPVEKKDDYGSQLNEAPQEGSLRSTTSQDISTDTTGTTTYVKDEPKPDGVTTVEDTQPVEKKDDYGSQLNEAPQEGSLTDIQVQLFKFLEDLNIKFDDEETYSIFVFGGGGAVALWLVAAVVGAIDSIPVLPKVLELVGLGYTLWFSSRYLILKKNRDELFARVEQIKQQVLGSDDD